MPRVEPVSEISPFELPLPSSQTFSLSDTPSTIEKSSYSLPYPPAKPVLEAPKSSGIWRMIENVLALETVGEKLMDLNNVRLERYFGKIRELDRQEAIKMQEAAQNTQNSSFWSFLKDMGALLLAALSTVLGLSLLSTGAGALIGGALVAAGVLSIINFTFKETGTWDWIAKHLAGENEDLHRKLAQILPAVVGGIAAVIGLAGSVGAFWFTELDFAQKILTIGQTAVNFATGVASIGEGVSKAKVTWKQSEIIELQSETKLVRFHLEETMTAMQDFLTNQTRISTSASSSVKAAERAVQIIHHSV